ncbi:hypothetical protein E2C01_020211 [Portunus trituberculatus]|uniref:Uncharacterized protein n=1 Tax=Portunus trituberculatus TaxID=210409 RepID=A0A5B7E147_PORTR|nr:hypothetical protein [Portunus trituberculatus]
MPPPHTRHVDLLYAIRILTCLHRTPNDMQSITFDERLFLPHQRLRISC